jgi:cyclic pyranopterin phosphate synthase
LIHSSIFPRYFLNTFPQALVLIPDSVLVLLDQNEDDRNEIKGPKGPVFATAIIAGVMGAKQTSNLIPFCHPLPLDHCEVKIGVDKALKNTIRIDCIVKTSHKTGVEMEALVGATLAALCVYDMLKAVSHDIVITDTKLIRKSGGKSDFGSQKSLEISDNTEMK